MAESYQEELYKIALEYCKENGYTLTSSKEDFINQHSIIRFICPKHGEQEKLMVNIKEGKKCKSCANGVRGQKSKLYWESTLSERSAKYYEKCLSICKENDYELLSPIEDFCHMKDYINYKCPEHGIHSIRIGNLLHGKRCPECQRENARKRYQLSFDEVYRRISVMGGKLLNKEDYINQTTKNLNITCPVCGEIFITSLQDFTQHGGQSCPNCTKKISIGERYIRDYLDEHLIPYESEKWFPDCRDVKPLPFDFYLPDQNYIIEFDGEQHFKEKHFFDSVEIGYIKKHDEIKTQYCKDNGINLIRIPYTQLNNIDKILDEELLA